ncbi:hypothetical protein SAMN04515669_6049 [Jiangella sp. DSM 45060]|nr:hypothetical protein SAMN04515669_6049 [Jiangella sp. DSM 45060]
MPKIPDKMDSGTYLTAPVDDGGTYQERCCRDASDGRLRATRRGRPDHRPPRAGRARGSLGATPGARRAATRHTSPPPRLRAGRAVSLDTRAPPAAATRARTAGPAHRPLPRLGTRHGARCRAGTTGSGTPGVRRRTRPPTGTAARPHPARQPDRTRHAAPTPTHDPRSATSRGGRSTPPGTRHRHPTHDPRSATSRGGRSTPPGPGGAHPTGGHRQPRAANRAARQPCARPVPASPAPPARFSAGPVPASPVPALCPPALRPGSLSAGPPRPRARPACSTAAAPPRADPFARRGPARRPAHRPAPGIRRRRPPG